MGLKIDKAEVTIYLLVSNLSLRRRNSSLKNIESQFEAFQGANDLQGNSWQTAKDYCGEIHATLIKWNIVANKELIHANNRFLNLIEAYLDKDKLDEDQLRSKVAELEQHRKEIVELELRRREIIKVRPSGIGDNRKAFETITAIDALISELKKDIQSLHDLELHTQNIYDEARSLQTTIRQGIAVVSVSSCFDFATGTYDTRGLDTSWKDKIELTWQQMVMSRIYDEKGQFGGDQGSPLAAFGGDDKGFFSIGDKGLRDILRKHFPGMTEADIRAYLTKLNSEGCGYVALVNAFLENYKGTAEEFEAEFGFPLYVNKNGHLEYNFNALLVDLYATSDNHNQVYGQDVIKNEDPSNTEGYGTNHESREYRFNIYLEAHNMQATFDNDIEASVESYNLNRRRGTVIIAVDPTILENANGKVAHNSSGGHAMTVVGTTKDGRLIVSSWGDKYYIDPDSYNNTDKFSFQVVNFD